jgi:ATP-dependent RNA helicase RhlE
VVEQLRRLKDWFFISTFNDLALDAALLRAVGDLGFTEATDIQRMAIPPTLEGRDILGSAPTGSGKSAAFGLPALQFCLQDSRPRTKVLVLVPTRELAQQVGEHLTSLAKHTKIRVKAVYGGVGFGPQIQAFRRGADIIVATPGRLIDLMGQGEARLDDIGMLVLDEADRMLDMGFLPAVRKIIGRMPAQRQTLFFSATLAGQAGNLARELLSDPVRVNVNPGSNAVDTVSQAVYAVEQQKKTDLLVDLLKDNTIYSAIVFTRTKARAERLASALARHNVRAERIHGDRSQSQRTRALEAFKAGRYRVLVATDVAARGIDVLDLGHVINYDVPAEAADYVHRIGRTGRAKKSGDAITFVSREEASQFTLIERMIGSKANRMEHPLAESGTGNILETATVRRRSFGRRRRR